MIYACMRFAKNYPNAVLMLLGVCIMLSPMAELATFSLWADFAGNGILPGTTNDINQTWQAVHGVVCYAAEIVGFIIFAIGFWRAEIRRPPTPP
jgi:hypothetical protein